MILRRSPEGKWGWFSERKAEDGAGRKEVLATRFRKTRARWTPAPGHRLVHFFWPSNESHETLGCQFTNAPLGFSFQAQTCSV